MKIENKVLKEINILQEKYEVWKQCLEHLKTVIEPLVESIEMFELHTGYEIIIMAKTAYAAKIIDKALVDNKYDSIIEASALKKLGADWYDDSEEYERMITLRIS